LVFGADGRTDLSLKSSVFGLSFVSFSFYVADFATF